jgi:hypothetical protein
MIARFEKEPMSAAEERNELLSNGAEKGGASQSVVKTDRCACGAAATAAAKSRMEARQPATQQELAGQRGHYGRAKRAAGQSPAAQRGGLTAAAQGEEPRNHSAAALAKDETQRGRRVQSGGTQRATALHSPPAGPEEL